jgi:hypothetical protein
MAGAAFVVVSEPTAVLRLRGTASGSGLRPPSELCPSILRGGTMESENVATVRAAYEAYAGGDLPTMLGLVDQDL